MTDGPRGDNVYNEGAAFIFTSPPFLTAYKNGYVDEHETEQLSCRMKYWVFPRAAPDTRNRSFKPCPACWSKWLLAGELQWQTDHGIPPDAFATKLLAAGIGHTPAAPPLVPAVDFLPPCGTRHPCVLGRQPPLPHVARDDGGSLLRAADAAHGLARARPPL